MSSNAANDPSWEASEINEDVWAAMEWIKRRNEWEAAWNRLTNSRPWTTALVVLP